MPYRSNAVTDADKSSFNAFKRSVQANPRMRPSEVEVRFTSRHVVVRANKHEHRLTRRGWEDWMSEGFPAVEGSDLPLPPQAAGRLRAIAPTEQVKGAVATATARPKVGPAVALAEHYLADLAHQALELGVTERANEQGRNAARFMRGELMIKLADVAKATDQRIKSVLSELNERTMQLAEANAILDYEPITEQEASTTRRVVEAFGSSGSFTLVDAISRVTGEPVVGDDGRPIVVNLTDVAMNKLAPLTSVANEDHNELLSFAYRNTERVVKKAKSVAKATEQPLIEVIRTLNEARVDATHPATGETIEVQPEGREAYDLLRGMVGEAPASDVVSIKTSRGWFESFFEPLRSLLSAAVAKHAPGIPLDSDGLVSNVFVLEHTIGQYFSALDPEGKASALAALVDAGTLSKRQASTALAALEYNSGTGRWEEAEPEVFTDEEVDAGEADDEFDDDEFDDDDDDGEWYDEDDLDDDDL